MHGIVAALVETLIMASKNNALVLGPDGYSQRRLGYDAMIR